MFIAIEGTDAAGKATQSQLLADRIEKSGERVFRYSFPRYETPLGAAILKHLKTELLLMGRDSRHNPFEEASEDALVFQCMMLADKYDAARDIITQLASGATVVTDRWWQSGWVYGRADGLEERWLGSVFRCLPQADLNIFIDVPPDEALRRRPEARDRYEKDREKQEVVRTNYNLLWETAKGPVSNTSTPTTPGILAFYENKGKDGLSGIWRRINGVASIEAVHEEIWHELVRASIVSAEKTK